MVKYLQLDDIKAYKIAIIISDYVWKVVLPWQWFEKKTLGSQWVTATDSIGANLAEGFGRYHKKDKQKFYYNARGSVYESIHWCDRAHARNLINDKIKE